MISILVSGGLVLFGAVVGLTRTEANNDVHSALVHTHAEFSFEVQGRYEDTFPLFGANEERKWAIGFEPHFIHPFPAHDEPGMVFTTVQAGQSRVWTNTALDPAKGHAQYVYFVADTMVALIDVQVTRFGTAEMQVSVAYERTALKPEANEEVTRLAQEDAESGPEWAEMINRYLVSVGKAATKSTR
jgi:hypothetical protein